MAINDSNTPFQGNGESTQSNANSFGSSFQSFHAGSPFAAPISPGVGNEIYSKLKEKLIEIYKATDPSYTVAVLDLDNVSEPSLRYSSLIVALAQKKTDNQEKLVAYHTLLLAGTNTDSISPLTQNIGNQQIEILRVPSDAYDKEMLTRAAEKVSSAFRGYETVSVEATVIPANFNPEDKTAVHKIALNAGMACVTELNVQNKEFRDLNLVKIKKDSSLQINHKYGRSTFDNIVNQPVRSDVRVEFVSRENGANAQNASLNNGNKEVTISTITGFIDQIYAPVVPQISNGYAMMPTVATQKYAPRLVLTDIDSKLAFTPSTILLAIVAAMTVGENNNWMQAYRPSDTPPGVIDMNDIGALSIEANVVNDPSGYGPMFETKANKITLPDLGAFMMTLIRPNLTISLDCPEAGPQSWYLSVFASAARGKQAAKDVIIGSANELFDGAFSRHFPQNAPLFAESSRVHLGTWIDKTGVKRDMRDFDHVAVCNLQGQSNPQAIRDFADTYLRTEFPLPQRLFARAKLLRGLSGETAEFTGYAERVTFSSHFLNALAMCVKESQIPVKVQTPLSASDFNNARGVGSFVEAAMMQSGVLFQQPQAFGYNNQNYGYFTSGTRW